MTVPPADWRDGWIYFALVDRFNNPSQPPEHAWDKPWNGFQGGNAAWAHRAARGSGRRRRG
jgi:hypothetical protein